MGLSSLARSVYRALLPTEGEEKMAGYYNRDIQGEPFQAYCSPEHLPAKRNPFWLEITKRRPNPPHSLGRYLEQCYGGRENLQAYLDGSSPYENRENVREHARRMSALSTPDGYAWTCWKVGADCEVCGTPC